MRSSARSEAGGGAAGLQQGGSILGQLWDSRGVIRAQKGLFLALVIMEFASNLRRHICCLAAVITRSWSAALGCYLD